MTYKDMFSMNKNNETHIYIHILCKTWNTFFFTLPAIFRTNLRTITVTCPTVCSSSTFMCPWG